MDPFQIETIYQRMTRDVYSDGGQIHKAAVCAIEVNWDEATKHPYRVQNFLPLFAEGWERRLGEEDA